MGIQSIRTAVLAHTPQICSAASAGKQSNIPTQGKCGAVDSAKACDQVSISSEGRSLSNSVSSIYGFTPRVPGQISVEELESHGRAYLNDFNAKLQVLFKQEGIDTSVPVLLGNASGSGDVIVTNGHPDKEKIEALFSNNFDLQNEQKKISQMLTTAQECRDAAKFQQAYRINPKQALLDYSYLMNSHLEGTISFSNNSVDIFFKRVNNQT